MKTMLRKELIILRKKQTSEAASQKSKQLVQLLLDSGLLQNIKSVHLYYPINKEVDTKELIVKLWKLKIKTIFPRTSFATRDLVNYEINSFSQLEKTTFNLQEPKLDNQIFSGNPDLILVPGVGFDKKMNRMGYGGGFYDKFLFGVKSLKVALAYELQLVDALPVEEHDIKMDMIITENKIYEGDE